MNLTTNDSAPAVQLDGVSRSFGTATALDNVTLSLPKGSIIGLIGRNGSGKTTLLRLVSGALVPTAGQVTTLGCPASELGSEVLQRLGALDQEIRLLKWMTVQQQLRYVAGFYLNWDRDLEQALVARLELHLHARIETLSGGNLQKLGLILALSHRPELILLDEPVSALDPVVRERVLEYLLEVLCEQGTTVVISSHVLRDVEKIVDRIVCLDRGKVRESAAVDELQERYGEWLVVATDPSRGLPERFSEPFVVGQTHHGLQARLMVRDADAELTAFRQRYRVEVTPRPLDLGRILLHLMEQGMEPGR